MNESVSCPCALAEPGSGWYYCDRLGTRMNAHWCRLYATKESYRRAWDEGRGPGQSSGAPPQSSTLLGGRPKSVVLPAHIVDAAERLAAEIADPSIVKKLGNYSRALTKWTKAGFPCRSAEEVARIYAEHCLPCKHRDPEADACRLCGCSVKTGAIAVRNKLAMATEACPRKKW